MLEKASGARCDDCPLKNESFVPLYRPSTIEYIALGEAPGAEEVEQRRPFVGQSGKLLQAVMKAAGIDFETVMRTNVVACRPPGNRTPTPAEIEACSGRLSVELAEHPKAKVLALGKTAHLALGFDDTDYWHSNAIGAYHPAYVLRMPNEIRPFYNSLLKAKHTAPGTEPPAPRVYVLNDLEEMLEGLPLLLANGEEDLVIDLETDQVDWVYDPILCVGLANSGDRAFIIPIELLNDATAKGYFKTFLAKYPGRIGGHNVKYDANFLEYQLGTHIEPKFDTMLAHYCTDEMPGGHSLKVLSALYFNAPDYEEELVQKHLRSRNDFYSKVPRDDLYKYCGHDVCFTFQLIPIMEDALGQTKLKDLYQLLLRAGRTLHTVEMRGMLLDTEHLEKVRDMLTKECAAHECTLNLIAGREINPRSPTQVAEVMYDVLKLPEGKGGRKVKPRSTDKAVLEALKGNPFVDELRKYRKKHKLLTSYVENLLDKVDPNGRIHPDLNLIGTETGRLSSFMHTIPRPGDPADELSYLGRHIRRSFVAEPGWKIGVIDYSQAELRVAAAVSGCAYLLDVFAQGRKIHAEISKEIFGPDYSKEQYVIVKMMDFSFLYGGNEFAMAETAKLPLEAARAMVRKLVSLTPELTEFKNAQFQLMCKQGYIETVFGRRRRMPLVTRDNRDEAMKVAINFPVQSSTSDLKLLSFCDATEASIATLLEVHDSIIITAPKGEIEEHCQRVRAFMIANGEKYFPQVKWEADIEISQRWGGDSDV